MTTPTQPAAPVPAVTYAAFDAMAEQFGVDPDIREALYPAVRDLLLLRAMLNRLAPELTTEIPVEALSVGVTAGLK